MRAKRLISFVLVLSMVLSLCPVVSFAEDATEPAAEYSYVFNSPAHNIQSDQRSLNSGYHTIENTVTSVSSGRWGFYDVRTATNYSTNATNTHWSFTCAEAPVAGDKIMALELEVPDGGTFDVSFVYAAHTNATKADFYVVKKPAETTGALGIFGLATDDDTSDSAYLGSVDMSTGSTADFERVTLESGNYIFIIVPNGASDTWTPLVSGSKNLGYLQFNSLTFTRYEAPVEHNFVFQNSVYDPNTAIIPRATLATYKMENIIEGSSDAWEFAGSRYLTDVRLGSESYSGQYKGLYWHSYTVRATSSAACMTLALDVKNKGSYIPKLSYYKFPSSSIVDIYLAPESVVGQLADETGLTGNGSYSSSLAGISALSDADKEKYYLGQHDMYDATQLTADELVFDEMLFETAETYYLIIHSVGLNANHTPMTSGSNTYIEHAITSLDLVPVTDDEEQIDELSSIEVSSSATNLAIGGTATLTTKATYTVSGETTLTSGVSYESGNTAVATVSGDTVTAVAEGTAVITATYEGKTADVTITVTESAPVVATETYEYRMTFDIINSENMPRTNDSALFGSSDYLRTAYGGSLYNKSKMDTDATFALDKDGNECTPYNVFKDDSSDSWEWASSYINTLAITSDHNALFGEFQVGRYGNLSSGFYFMLRVNVPQAGKYTLSFDGNRKEGYCAPAIYFQKDDGSALSENKNKDYSKFKDGFVGYANFADTEKTGYVNVGTVTIEEAGDYYLAVFPTADSKIKSPTSESAQKFELCGFKLAPFVEGDDANDLLSIDASVPETELEVDATAEIQVIANYSRTGLEIMTSGVTITCDKPEIAEVSGTTITAKAAGKATITVEVSGTQIKDTIDIEVLAPDAGNAGVIREYKTTWDALQLDKLPKTSDSSLYGSGPYTRGGTLFQNMSLMNRDAVSNLNANAEEVEPWRLMDLDYTAPWDMAYQQSPGGVRIQKATNDLFLNYQVSNYGKSSGTLLALRVEVPNKGIYNLSFDSNNVAHGINPAIYFFRDDGTLSSAAAIYSHITENETPVAYYDFSDTTQTGYKKVAQVEAPRQGEYFIVFYCDEASKTLNETVAVASGKSYQHLYLNGIRLSALPGELANVDIEIESLRTEADPMPLLTEKQISYQLSDALGVPIDEIDEEKLTVTYDSFDKEVAIVSDTGVISALTNGTTEISVSVEYDGASASAAWELLVAPAGRNIAEHLNPSFDTDEWIWMGATNEPEPSAEAKFVRSYIATEDDGNRALRFELNPEVGASGITIFFKNDGHRLEVKPGDFYQLTFKFKTDYVVPSGGSDFDIIFDIYSYNNATGTSSSSIAFASNRSANFVSNPQYEDARNGWTEVVVPLGAPTEYEGDVVYITPRLVMRPTSADSGKLGYSGNFWIDDVQVREVGYAGVEISTTGSPVSGQTLQVQAKPYTTLGHYISLGGTWGTDQATFASTDVNVIKDFTNMAFGKDGLGTNWLNATATMGGKNGTTEVSCAMEINGVTRVGTGEITTSGFEMKLLYAEAVAEQSTVAAGGSTKIIPTGYMSDGSVADMTSGNISYKSLTPDIVTVDAEGNVSALRAGVGQIQANLLLGEAGTSAIAEITVTDSTPIVSATLAECATVGYLRDEPLFISGVMESGFEADIDAAEIEWIITSDPVDGISIDENNYVFGEIFGAKATVSAKVTLNGATVETNAIEIEVVETDKRDFVITFNDAHPTKPKNVTIEEHGWEINKTLSHSSALSSTFTTQGLYGTTNGEGRPIVIDLELPYEGAYQIIFRGTYNNYNALDGDIYCDGTYVGTYEFWSNGRNASAEPERMRSLYLEAGKHTFTFVPGKSGGKNYYQILSEIRFRALDDMPEITAITTDSDSYSLVVGDTVALNAEMLTADDYTYSWQTKLDGSADEIASVAYESEDESIAKVDENGVITALKSGETVITIKANSDKWSLEKDISVVVDGSDINVAALATDRRTFYVSEKIALDVDATLASGAVLDPSKMSITWTSSDSSIVSFDADGVMTANAVGNATIKATIEYYNEPPFETQADITVEEDRFGKVEINADSFVFAPNSSGTTLTAVGKTYLDKDVDISGATISWETSDASVAAIDENGNVTPGVEGSAKITATVELDGITVEGEAMISVRAGKVGRTYYTDEMVDAARENTQKYSWAISLRKSAVSRADKYLDKIDFIYEMIPGEGLPRTSTVGYRNDPQQWYCRYCGEYLYDRFGHYPYVVNVMSDPWKLQCPSCKRRFPSNDFAKLYELGRDEHGIYNIELAEARNAELVEETNGEVDYMKNVLYPEIGSDRHPSSITLSEGEDPTRWGVDTGLGYTPGRTYSNGVKEVHTYIGYIMHCGIWYDAVGSGSPGLINRAVNDLAEAYMYTGDIKYGRAGAILVDRIADVYPGYDLRPYLTRFANSDGGAKRGKIIGSIWETYLGQDLVAAYDAFFPAYDDSQVVEFLSEKAKKFNLENDKSTPEKIRSNCEDGLLRETYKAVSTTLSMGNTGMHQNACAMAAIILDTHPDTDEMIDWIFQYSESDSTSYNTGGGINQALVDSVGRDGQATESAFGYNRIWVTQLTDVANTLARYDEYTGMSLYEHPKYVGMIQSYPYVTLVRRGVPAIGDGGGAASYPVLPDNDDVMIQSFKYLRDTNPEIAREIAQHMYFVKGSDLSNLHYDVFTRYPESLADEVESIINNYGEWDYDKSSMLTGYGIGILRSGTLYESVGTDVLRDTQRDFWIYFGGATSHSNNDQLSLGIEAYGIGMTTDLGYPEATGHDPNRAQWMNPTISHNTVVVNEKSQARSAYSQVPLHYDAKDTRVKVLDVDGTPSYTETDEYRRTVVMIDYDSDVSYGVDFFKVVGGDDHLYSFHANSDVQPTTSENLNFEQQIGGSYAGADVPFGNDPWTNVGNNYTILKYPVGYTWLFDVYRADNPGVSDFWIDYEIQDFRKLSRNENMDIHLRMTMVNDWIADEVTLANGMPPRNPGNLAVMDHLEYMLVRRKGKDLDTLFTTVIEPYNKERYIESIESVPVTVKEGTPGEFDSAKAVKVTLVDGRTDYVVYARNNEVTYNIDGLFDFKGFVGVWTVNTNGDNIYTYVNDGEMIGNDTEKVDGLDAAFEGTIIDFQHELSFDNWIDVKFDRDVTEEEVADLADRMLVMDRETLGNSSFVICGAEKTGANTARLDLNGVTTIDKYVDAKDESLGYVYDLEIGKHFAIPMSYEDNQAPIFDSIDENLSTNAGSVITVKVNATAQDSDTGVTYSARQLPRGATFDTETGTFSWKPTSSQIGENLVGIDATDESGRTSTLYFTITVYGSTAGGTGGGGGSGTSSPSTTPDSGSDDDDDSSSTTTPDEGSTTNPEGGNGADAENVRFIDLGNHAWAADSINSLADDGIVKGTTPNTYSPANNITRADFALLLVRAFELESDNAENFDDVSDSDYFAAELAIARNTGIVNGIGDNKYAPRNTITRQDMMLILYRALVNLGVEFEAAEIDYPDVADISDYAEEAVKALVSAGLVNGKSGRLAPKDYTTRAEVAVLLKRILDYTTK